MLETVKADSSVLLVLINLLLRTTVTWNTVHTQTPPDAAKTRNIFKVVWNSQSTLCRSAVPDLQRWGIIHNKGLAFHGEEIVTLYDGLAGNWPYLDLKMQYHNGGIPQDGNLTLHLLELERELNEYVTDNSDGYAVVDMEHWRPLFRWNFGKHFENYRTVSESRVRKAYPFLAEAQVPMVAKREFDAAARKFLAETLALAKRMRPNRRWGFYFFPWTYGHHGHTYPNKQLYWLYEASSGIFPSIYLKKAATKANQLPQATEYRRRLINEALRFRKDYSSPCTHVVPYTWVQEGPFNFNETYLDLAIGLPADLGCDGVILWASYIVTNTAEKCRRTNNYVQETLGPYVANLLNRLYECSQNHCSGHGRCIKREQRVFHPDYYVQCYMSPERAKRATRNTNSFESDARPSDDQSRYSRDNAYDGYVCQCFYGWIGRQCEINLTGPSSNVTKSSSSILKTETFSGCFFLSWFFVLFCVRSIWPSLFYYRWNVFFLD